MYDPTFSMWCHTCGLTIPRTSDHVLTAGGVILCGPCFLKAAERRPVIMVSAAIDRLGESLDELEGKLKELEAAMAARPKAAAPSPQEGRLYDVTGCNTAQGGP